MEAEVLGEIIETFKAHVDNAAGMTRPGFVTLIVNAPCWMKE